MTLRLAVEGRQRHWPLELDLSPGATGAALYDAIAGPVGQRPDAFGLQLRRTGEMVHPGAQLTAYALRSGDRLAMTSQHPRTSAPRLKGRPAMPAHLAYHEGSLVFNRPPRVITEAPVRVLDLEAPPPTPPRRQLPLLASLVPMAIGGIVVAVTGQLIYLVFMAGTPLMAVGTWLTERRSGRRDFASRSQRYAASIDQTRAEATAAQAQGIAWRHDHNPAPGVVAEQIATLSAVLWQRRPADPDFLELRIGAADQPSLVSVRVASGGDEALARQAAALSSHFTTDPAVPVALPLREAGVMGIVGAGANVSDAARWLILQVAAQHSPRECALAVLAPTDPASWEWVKWLPHTEALRPGRLLTGLSDGSATRLFEELRELQAERAAGRASLVTGATTLLPHVVVLVQPPLPLAAADVASFLEECPKMGMSVMWIAQDRGSLPGAAQVVVEAGAFGGTLTHTAGGKQVTRVTLDGLSLASATEAAMALAPLRDRARGAASTTLPDRVDLIDLLDPVPLTGDAVVARWSQTPKSLLTQVGMGTGAPASLDLDRDGPHGLIAGTTGSGKSELLQTLVASLAATFPPTRVNFVLVDYKGGAAFKECVALPHTVGFVTDLDEHLAERAIVSLNAELVRRERLLASAGFKDLPAMRIKNAAAAPPDLLLIVDEFAALKAEVPRFIDGVVDIARRGRSLGIHLLLATQKPRGVISGDIQANTNLRIVLRVTDPEESTDVIGRPDAARLSRHRPGRALVKTGPMEVAEIQVAHAGGTAPRRRNLEPARLFTAESRAIPATRSSGTAPTHLAAIVAACVEAARQAGLPAPRRPWLAELPHLVQLDSLDTGRPEVPSAAIAQADDTNSQAQPPWVLDLARAGSAVIYGSAGTGKTTALRTIAAALARTYSTDEVHLYGLDFAGRGLAPLTSLPHCGDVVYGEEQERVRRLITMLEGMVLERRALLATIGASSAAEYWRLSGESLPSVVVLVDGLSQLWESLEKVDRGTLLDAVQRLVAEGRAAGLHFVLTADRRGAVPHALHAVVPVRIALRLANPDEYAMLGLLLPKAYQKAPPGRAWVESEEIQFAVPIDGPDAGGAAQTKALAALGKRLAVGSVKPVPVRLLPGHILLKDLPAPGLGQRHVPIGLDEHSLAPIAIDLGHQASFLVAGPSGSGRTTVLRVLGTGLRRAFPDAQCFLIGSRRSDLFDEPWWVEKARALPDAEALAARLVEQMAAREASTPPGPLLVVAIDDADPYTEGRIASSIELLVNRAEDANAVVLVAMSTFRAGRGYAPWVQALRHQGSGLLLQPRDDTDGDVFHLILPRRSGVAMPAGRGYLIQGSAVTLIQAAE